MRAGFVTCVELGLSCMEEIRGIGGRLYLAITLQDDIAPAKAGRVHLDAFCRESDTPLLKVESINEAAATEAVREAKLDWLFVIGWSQIAAKATLNAPGRGVLGMHPTLLPVGRGRASIPWAILKGLPETGVTLFQLDAGVDTGPIVAQERVAVGVEETATTLYMKIADAHRSLIRSAWPHLETGEVILGPQDETKATEWPGRTPADGRITSTMCVNEVERLVRATTRPYPGAFSDKDATRRLRIWRGSTIPTDGIEIVLADGSYFATEYEWEQTGSASAP